MIRNGLVIDGTGAPARRADIAISGGRIVLVSATPIARDARRAKRCERDLSWRPASSTCTRISSRCSRCPTAESDVRQGVTLALGGPDGGGPWPFGAYLDSRRPRSRSASTSRFSRATTRFASTVMGTANRAPTAAELTRMQAHGRASRCSEGAFGLSTGLRYIPGFYSKTDEVVALSEVAADSGGIYTSHLREEGVGLIDGVAEALEIGRRAHIPVVLTHHKAIGKPMWGKSVVTLAHGRLGARGRDRRDDRPVSVHGELHRPRRARCRPGRSRAARASCASGSADPVLKDSITRGIVELPAQRSRRRRPATRAVRAS